MADSLFDGTIDLLSKSLDIRSRRHAVISSNITNAETPGYKARDISFEDELQKALTSDGSEMKKTHARHLAGAGEKGGMIMSRPTDPDGSLRNDDNNVSMDEEMSKLAQNTIQYNTATQMIAKKFAGLKYAISEGRR